MSAEEILQFYDDDYLFFAAAMTNAERTENELDFIWQALQLDVGKSVLDVGCGAGRIANGLARRGANVVGIDLVPLFLDRARADAAAAKITVDFRLGDMRCLANIGSFDAVLVWFFSFGYHSDEENVQIVEEISRVTKPGGLVLIDQYNPSALARAGDGYTILDLGGSLLIQRTICDLETSRWGAERMVVRDGTIRRSHFLCRSYTPTELKVMFRKANLSCRSVWAIVFNRWA